MKETLKQSVVYQFIQLSELIDNKHDWSDEVLHAILIKAIDIHKWINPMCEKENSHE